MWVDRLCVLFFSMSMCPYLSVNACCATPCSSDVCLCTVQCISSCISFLYSVINLHLFKPTVTKHPPPSSDCISFFPLLFSFFLRDVKLALSQVWEETAVTPPLTLRGGLCLLSVNWAELILTKEQSSRYWCPHLLGSIVRECVRACVCVCVCVSDQTRP